MNERIDELMIQAGARFEMMNWVHYDDFEYKKFAELIVKECIDCAVWVGKSNHNTVEPIHTAHAVKRRIEKHFGVEK